MCFDFFLQGLSETFFTLRRNEPDTIKIVYRSSRNVLFSVACPALQRYSTFCTNGSIFDKKVNKKVCFDFFYKVCLKHFSL